MNVVCRASRSTAAAAKGEFEKACVAALYSTDTNWHAPVKQSGTRNPFMPARIRHIALSVKDIDATADFYEKAFGLKRSPKSEGPTAYRIYMSDGEINLALLQYKSDVGSGLTNPSEFVGIHHFGFQCDDLENQQEKIEAAGGKFFFDLGDPDDDDFERKFRDPNGIIFDVNWKGWSMTSSKVAAQAVRARAAAKKSAAKKSKPKAAARRKR
jgi:catechol 2,3-dioxygenase-like lactoylglutathione lyase family enzyme